jgi:hypothetical protein
MMKVRLAARAGGSQPGILRQRLQWDDRKVAAAEARHSLCASCPSIRHHHRPEFFLLIVRSRRQQPSRCGAILGIANTIECPATGSGEELREPG